MTTTVSSLANLYSAAVTYNAATGTTSTGSSATSASTTTAATTANTSGELSADVAAKVTAALQPAQAGITMLNTAMTTGQTKISALGQVQSAIADFQTLAKGLSTTSTTGTTGATPTADAVSKNVQSFVTAYNALATKLQTLGAGDLKSDPGLAQVSAQMTQALRDAGGTSGSGALSKAGIALSGSGQLTVDSTKLSAALAADPSAVANLLGGNGSGTGVMDKVSSKLAAVSSAGGVIGRETTSATTALSTTVSKRDALTKALTAQATALAAMYTQQEQADSGSTTTSLFDMLG
jgi:flagellar capping protein FliD